LAVAREEVKLKLGKGAAFVKSRLKRLRQEDETWEMEYKDSTTTTLSDIIPEGRRRFRFLCEYDFGDSWRHEVLFEKRGEADAGRKYPLCVDGARACPPEDVGGTWGYTDFVEAIKNEDNEQHDEMLEWVGGSFDPEAFDLAAATKRVKKGLPDWRRML